MVIPTKRGQPEHYLFVIDTNQYAGSFERPMCAYMTGIIGECEVGNKEAEQAKKEIPTEIAVLEQLVEQVPDEHGCHRPVTILPNPRYGNDGKGKHQQLTDDNKNKFQWPAYYSVAIYFHTQPSLNEIKLLKERAQKFAVKEGITIEGFRFLEEYKTYR